MQVQDTNLVTSFKGVLDCFVEGNRYRESPPAGPPDSLPSLSDEELMSLQRTIFGEKLSETGYSYSEIRLIEDPMPVPVELPTLEQLRNINICGIDGSNQRVERSTFYFILARAAIVEFRYSTINAKPYFYNRQFDSNAVLWVDGNVFSDEIQLQTETIPISTEGNANILRKIQSRPSFPFLLRHDPEKINKSPSSHALGWGVKIQQAQELACLAEIPIDIPTVCVKDGPLFSTSVSPHDTQEGLNPICGWTDQFIISCSKRIKDSKLLVEALMGNGSLRDYWFRDQCITDKTLNQVSSDSILLPRILKPGQRTPLMKAIQVARQRIAKDEPRLTPVSCYYLSRHQPNTYIRMEIPLFMWERNPEQVNRAIEIVAWQHELGHRAPLVQLAADLRCQIAYERQILEKQTISYLHRKGLRFPEDY